MNIVQQTGGSIGTAVMSVVLTNQIKDSPAAERVLRRRARARSRPTRCRPPVLAAGPGALAEAFGNTYLVARAC